MTADLSAVDRSHVLLAIAECDEVGAEAFLDAYDVTAGGPVVAHEDATYDARVILAAAQRHATGTAATDIDGEVEVLEELGFTVEKPRRDVSEVGFEESRAAWAEAARPTLLVTAQRYRATLTHTKLAAAVQESTGIITTQLAHRWIGDVLRRVTDECQSLGEPLLSSLCVTSQGSVGETYADAVEHARGVRPDDPDEHAAEERLACYRHWEATGLPPDGGTPLRTAHFKTVRKATAKATSPRAAAPRTTAPRKTAARKAAPAKAAVPEPAPLRLCPKCFTAVPSTGVCDYCD